MGFTISALEIVLARYGVVLGNWFQCGRVLLCPGHRQFALSSVEDADILSSLVAS